MWAAYSTLISAQEIERPLWSLGDSWTYQSTTTAPPWEGGTHFRQTRKFTIVELRKNQYRAEVSTIAKFGAEESTNANWGISRNLNTYYRQNAQLPWTELEFLRWPLVAGKRWTFANPMADGSKFDWRANADRWEEVDVPAGRFRAIVIEIEGQPSDGGQYSQKRTIWFAPEVKATVKESWSWYGRVKLGGELRELESYALH